MSVDLSLLSYVDSHRNDMLLFLSRIVGMESPSGDSLRVGQVADTLDTMFRDAGCVTRRVPVDGYAPHLVAETAGGEGGPRVLLVGHCDTVYPVGTLASMPVRVEGERLLGPGVMDMKGGLVAILFAVKALLAVREGPLNGTIRIVVNTDEEPGSHTSRPLWPELAGDVDWALVFEPALEDGSLIHRRKGVGVFQLKVSGRAAHAGAEPEKGANAIVALAKKIVAMADLTDLRLGTTLNAGVARGGNLPYVVPDAAEAMIDIRVPSDAERERILDLIGKISAREDVPGTRCRIQGHFHRPPMGPTDVTKRLKQIIEEEAAFLGLPVQWASCGSVSDANNIAAQGVPTIDGMGPSGGRAHSPEEWMNIPSLFQKTALLAGVLDRIVGREAMRSR
jgi:glutamate carboxypeptidase